jgi:hypothetical protein
MSVTNGNRHVNPNIASFVIRREESNYGLPDGETAYSFLAIGYGDDVDGEQRLWQTLSYSEDECLRCARACYPNVAYIGRELPVMGGERL